MIISYAATFTKHVDSLPSNSIDLIFLFVSLQCCYRNDLVIVTIFKLLRAGELIARRMDFRKSRLE